MVKFLWCGVWVFGALSFFPALGLAQNVVVTTRHAPTINGAARVEGSLQQLLGEDVHLNGGAVFTEDLLVPGTPQVLPNGNVTWDGLQVGSGPSSPTGYSVRLNGGAVLRNVRTRTALTVLPSVAPPQLPTGTRMVS